ncbi:MAG: hypothetical protein ABI901_11645, partial [Roseiflexaceae bacterium]
MIDEIGRGQIRTYALVSSTTIVMLSEAALPRCILRWNTTRFFTSFRMTLVFMAERVHPDTMMYDRLLRIQTYVAPRNASLARRRHIPSHQSNAA